MLFFPAFRKLSQEKFHEAFSDLDHGYRKFEELRELVGDSDQFKRSFAGKNAFPCQQLSLLNCAGNPSKTLYAAELGRVRALADLMATQYSAKTHISAEQQSWTALKML